MHNTPETDKANFVAFFEMMFNDCDPAGAIALYVGEDYFQHKLHVVSG